MKFCHTLGMLLVSFGLTACGGSLCGEYNQIPSLDRDLDGQEDYLYQVLGDSIMAYNTLNCSSVGHFVGFDTDQRVLSNAVTGAKLYEIAGQYQPPTSAAADYDYVIINGGLNDIIADTPMEGAATAACDCNGLVNHDACVAKLTELEVEMAELIASIHQTSSANIALVTYYPAETSDSFIGACFPYVEELNARYRSLAQHDDRVFAVETYGTEQDVIRKVNVFGRDNYHPTVTGSRQIASQLVEQLGLLAPDLAGSDAEP